MSKQEDLDLLNKRIKEKRLMIRDIDNQIYELQDRRTVLERDLLPLQKQANRIGNEMEDAYRQQMKTEYMLLSPEDFYAINTIFTEAQAWPHSKIRFVQRVRMYSQDNDLVFVGLREAVRLYEALC